MAQHFLAPRATIEGLQLFKLFLRKIETAPLSVVVVSHPANRCFLRQGAAASAVHNPFQHAHVFAKAGPHKTAVSIFAKPVHMKNARRFAERTLHANPDRKSTRLNSSHGY